MQIFSWNVNGLRAGLKKGTFQSFIADKHPDILCLQETKAKPGQAIIDLPEYQEIWNSAERPGYSGTAIFTKIPPIKTYNNFTNDIIEQYDWESCLYGNPLIEGRLQTAEFTNFYLVNTYVPNSKRDLSRLTLREKIWDPALLQYINHLAATKPVVVCGDFNAAHTAIDLARPKSNEHNAGYTIEERQGITNYLANDLADTFRHFHPTEQKYTWWSHMGHARENNVGWRIDYFFITSDLLPNLKSAEIYDQITGSDHCPISITLEF